MVLITLEFVLQLAAAVFPKLEPKEGFEFSATVDYYTWFGGIKGPVVRQTVDYYQDGSQSKVVVERPFEIQCTVRRRGEESENPTAYQYVHNNDSKLLLYFPLDECFTGGFQPDWKSGVKSRCFRNDTSIICSRDGSNKYQVRKLDKWNAPPTELQVATTPDPELLASIVGYAATEGLSIIYDQSTKKITAKTAKAIMERTDEEKPVPNLLKWKAISSSLYETIVLDPKYLTAVLGDVVEYSGDNEEPINAWATVQFHAYPKPANDDTKKNENIVEALCTHAVKSKRNGVTVLFGIISFAYLFLYTPLCAALVVWILIDRRLHEQASDNSGRSAKAPEKKSPNANPISPATGTPTPARNEDEDVVGENSAFGKKN